MLLSTVPCINLHCTVCYSLMSCVLLSTVLCITLHCTVCNSLLYRVLLSNVLCITLHSTVCYSPLYHVLLSTVLCITLNCPRSQMESHLLRDDICKPLPSCLIRKGQLPQFGGSFKGKINQGKCQVVNPFDVPALTPACGWGQTLVPCHWGSSGQAH